MQGDPSQGGPITFREDSMISQIDIDAWAEDFNNILEDLPFEERKLKYKEEGEDYILDLSPFVTAFGRALLARVNVTLSKRE